MPCKGNSTNFVLSPAIFQGIFLKFQNEKAARFVWNLHKSDDFFADSNDFANMKIRTEQNAEYRSKNSMYLRWLHRVIIYGVARASVMF